MDMSQTREDILDSLKTDEDIAALVDQFLTLTSLREELVEQCVALEKACHVTEATQEALIKENDSLVADNAVMSKDIVALKRDNEFLVSELGKLIEQIKIANARAFGAKSEKIHPHQISLFNDMEAASEKTVPEPSTEEVLPRTRKKKTGIDYSKFETVVIEHTLPVDERICDTCGSTTEEMGVEIKRVIKLIPARLVVEEHRRHVYVCKPCSRANAADAETPVTIIKASMPNQPLEKSCASPSLLAYILHAKYSLALPVYRISDDLKNSQGLTLSRQTLGGWVIRCSER